MGSAAALLTEGERQRLGEMADELARAIVDHNCVAVTGATTGLPYMVSRAVRQLGGLAIGISPAATEDEHVNRYGLPLDGTDVIIYTGFGLKGRNVINIRSSDVVVIFGGGMGALNEFTIAYDEGRIIGVVKGSGGVADHIEEIVDFASKPTTSRLIFDHQPDRLIESCLRALAEAR
jgi:uncharacterized protein (TIGR00725 family)